MSPRQTNILLLAFLLAGVALPSVLPTRAAEVPGEEEVAKAREAFENAWKEAASKFKRSVELEGNLRYYDQKVDETKRSLEEATLRKQEVRDSLDSTKDNVDALRNQLDTLHAVHKERLAQIAEERHALGAYVRLVSAREIAETDAGVVVGNPLVDALTQDSLGESVERSLYHTALLDARSQMFERLVTLELESGNAIRNLQGIALRLGVDLISLQQESENLDSKISAAGADFLEQLKTRDLTEAQLSSIRDTVAEVNARVVDAQRSLARINADLKNHAEQEYGTKIAAALDTRRTLLKKSDDLTERRQVLVELKTAAQEAYAAMRDDTTVDRRQQQRIEDAKAEIRQAEEQIKNIDVTLATPLPEDATRDDHVAYDRLGAERAGLVRQIDAINEKISFMQQGYVEPRVEEYLRRRTKAQRADQEIKEIDAELATLGPALADAEKNMADIEAEHAKVEADSDVFTVFTWPVYGPITAGFMDSSYQKVFGVPHRGIDISTPQGSPVYAISEGVVLTARNGGKTGYSYVLIGHRDGYTSLYGHLSKIYVSPGDVLDHGQVIGLSGGTPGTSGAGLMTTGPHVHLEIHRNGQYLNPFQVLVTGQ